MTDKEEYLRILGSLETNELAVLYRQSANADPAGLKRKDMLGKLDEMPIPDDFHRQVGEIRHAADFVQEPGSSEEETKDLEPDDEVFSSQPGKWSLPMSLGPDRTEEANRLKWARLLYQEQRRNRMRLLDDDGVFLCDWDDETNNFVPIPDDDRSAADTATLCYRTPNSKTTLAWIGQRFELDLNMLLHWNGTVYPTLSSTSTEFKKATMIVLEEEIPEDMIDRINQIFNLGRIDPTPTQTQSETEKRPAPPEIDAAAMSARHAAKRARRPKTAEHVSIEAESDMIKDFVAAAVATGKIDSCVAARLGVPVGGATAAGAPSSSRPKTAEAVRIATATEVTQGRIDLTATGGDQGNWDNPYAFHRIENMSADQRLRMLEGTKSVPIFSDPTEFANATARLAVENPALSPAAKEAAIRTIFNRELAMNAYIKTASLGSDEVKKVMSQVSLDLVVGASEDETLKAFEKRTQTLVNKKLKKAAEAPAASASADTAASVVGVLQAQFPHVFEKKTRAEKRREYLEEHHGDGGGRGGRGRGGGRGGRYGRGRGACFVCGSPDHQAADCPKRFEQH